MAAMMEFRARIGDYKTANLLLLDNSQEMPARLGKVVC